MKRSTFLLALPSLILIALFVVVIVAFARTSLLHLQPGTALISGPMSLDNYARILNSSGAWRAVWTTLRLSAIITMITVVAGYPLARILALTPSQTLRRVIMFCLIATFLSGGVTRAYAWMIILGHRGIINMALGFVGIAPLRMLNNEFAVIVAVVNFTLPFFVLTLFGALRTIPRDLEDAARNLGASRWRSFVTVTLPLSVPGLVVSTSLCFAMTLGAFLFPQLLGGGRVHVLATEIYERIQASYDIPAASALAVIFFFIVLLILVMINIIQKLTRKIQNGRIA